MSEKTAQTLITTVVAGHFLFKVRLFSIYEYFPLTPPIPLVRGIELLCDFWVADGLMDVASLFSNICQLCCYPGSDRFCNLLLKRKYMLKVKMFMISHF